MLQAAAQIRRGDSTIMLLFVCTKCWRHASIFTIRSYIRFHFMFSFRFVYSIRIAHHTVSFRCQWHWFDMARVLVHQLFYFTRNYWLFHSYSDINYYKLGIRDVHRGHESARAGCAWRREQNRHTASTTTAATSARFGSIVVVIVRTMHTLYDGKRSKNQFAGVSFAVINYNFCQQTIYFAIVLRSFPLSLPALPSQFRTGSQNNWTRRCAH